MRKKREMHITFHNPNTAEESDKMAKWFIEQVAEKALNRAILDIKTKKESNEDEEL